MGVALCRLENCAVLNYDGFTKILKKHDKVVGWATRERFLAKLVKPASFAELDDLSASVQTYAPLLLSPPSPLRY